MTDPIHAAQQACDQVSAVFRDLHAPLLKSIHASLVSGDDGLPTDVASAIVINYAALMLASSFINPED